jgi:undecaprenyl-diphosphatase
MVSNETLKVSLHAVWLHFPHPAVSLAGGFPSGHALCATILYGFLTVFSNSYLDLKALRIVTFAVSVVIVFIVCVSRIYLSAHYLSDVIGGVLEGIVWLNAVGIALDKKQVTATAPALVGNSRR